MLARSVDPGGSSTLARFDSWTPLPYGEGLAFNAVRCAGTSTTCIRVVAGVRRSISARHAKVLGLERFDEPPGEAYIADDGRVRCKWCAQRVQDETERRNRKR